MEVGQAPGEPGGEHEPGGVLVGEHGQVAHWHGQAAGRGRGCAQARRGAAPADASPARRRRVADALARAALSSRGGIVLMARGVDLAPRSILVCLAKCERGSASISIR